MGAQCTNAIKCDPYNFKALFRRGRAHRHLKDEKKARRDLLFLQQFYKQDLQITNELKLLQLADYETDRTVIDETEEKENETTNSGYGDFIYIGIAIFVMIIAISFGLYFAWK